MSTRPRPTAPAHRAWPAVARCYGREPHGVQPFRSGPCAGLWHNGVLYINSATPDTYLTRAGSTSGSTGNGGVVY